MDKQRIKSRKKDLLKIISVILFLEVILLFFIIFITIISIGTDDPEKVVNGSDFSGALNDSIKKYGTEFTGALSVYLMEFGSFDSYKEDNFSHTIDEIKELVDKESDIKSLKDIFESFYGGIEKDDKKGRTYYDWYFPIASGYKVDYVNSWGDKRNRPNGEGKHEGTDLICKEGTPIIAVESGKITGIGWNMNGGWRISITSKDGKRYWFYAHMRKVHPYVKSLKKGSEIEGGQVIGYVGSTGYSNNIPNNAMPENENAIDGKFVAHLHIGVYRVLNGTNVAYNAFHIMEVLKVNKIAVIKKEDEYVAAKKGIEDRLVKLNLDIDSGLGGLSGKYESNGNPGTIANTPGDPGGKSYGAFQFAVNRGSLNSFLIWLSNSDKILYDRLMNAKRKDGNTYGVNFDNEWEKIADEKPEYFYTLQYNYIKYAYFDPVVEYFRKKGFDIEIRSNTLQAVVWSTSVQHGTGGAIGIISIQNLKAIDREIIIGIYNERMRVDVYFSNSSPAVRQAVYDRFERELQDALEMLEAEGG